MSMARTPELKGFDSYELKLGDELRGERASKGKTLLDVQRDLRIKADYIDAIENADASAFPFAGFAAGYVRSYARYLGLDGDDVYRRFCEESGFGGVEGVVVNAGAPGGAKAAASRPATTGTAPIETRFMPAAHQKHGVEIAAGLRGLASIAVLACLVVGLGYGGWNILQNIQRVGFAPLPSAPSVQVSAPDFFSPGAVAAAEAPGAMETDDARLSLAALYAEQEAVSPMIEPRDGPISSIDPAEAGIYAPPRAPDALEVADLGEVEGIGDVDPALMRALEAFSPSATDALTDPAAPAGDEPAFGPTLVATTAAGVSVLATDEAWVRVRDGRSRVLFTGILGAGEQFPLPPEATEPELRAGNAGAVYIVVDGAAFGPLGDGPEVAKGVKLTPDAVRAAYPRADVAFAPLGPNDREASLPSAVALAGD